MAEGKGGAIGAVMTLDTSKFSKGLEDSSKQATDFVSKIQGKLGALGGGNLGGAFGALNMLGGLGTLTTGGAVGGLIGGLTLAIEKFNELGQAGFNNITSQAALARRFELTASAAGALQLSLEAVGGTNEDVTAGMARFEHTLEQAQRGSATARAAFAAFGVTGEQLERPAEALRTVFDLLGRLPEREASAAREIFGRGSYEPFRRAALRAQARGGLGAIEETGLESGAIADAAQVGRIADIGRRQRELDARIAEIQRRNENNASELWGQIGLARRGAQAGVESQTGMPWWAALLTMGGNPIRASQIGMAALRGATGNEQGIRTLRAHHEENAPAGGTGAPSFNFADRQQLNQLMADWDRATQRLEQLQDRLSRETATMGMSPWEVQRWEIIQQRQQIQADLLTEAARQRTEEERRHTDEVLRGLDAAQQQVEAAERVREIEAERLANLTLRQRFEEINRHNLDPNHAARLQLEELHRTERRLGLNLQPADYMLPALGRGSVGAINFLNLQRLTEEMQNRPIEDRFAAADQADSLAIQSTARDIADILRLMQDRQFLNPVN
jgi:hypothetical protein